MVPHRLDYATFFSFFFSKQLLSPIFVLVALFCILFHVPRAAELVGGYGVGVSVRAIRDVQVISSFSVFTIRKMTHF